MEERAGTPILRTSRYKLSEKRPRVLPPSLYGAVGWDYNNSRHCVQFRSGRAGCIRQEAGLAASLNEPVTARAFITYFVICIGIFFFFFSDNSELYAIYRARRVKIKTIDTDSNRRAFPFYLLHKPPLVI